MEKQYILFDLDGTLTDPMVGITKSVQHALKSFGIVVEDLKELTPFIGPPLKESFQERYQMTEEEADQAVKIFREYFVPKGIFENEVYDGIESMLKSLNEAGKSLMIATSKPIDFAEQILEHFGLRDYFDYVAGSTLSEGRTKKDEVIAYALDECQLVDMSELIMVGDRKYDVLGAKAFGIKSIGVLYGYGSLTELEEAGADYIVETVEELQELLLKEE
ncbi:MAG: HAD family hydrolase [Lachnospiraceae bacterium]